MQYESFLPLTVELSLDGQTFSKATTQIDKQGLYNLLIHAYGTKVIVLQQCSKEHFLNTISYSDSCLANIAIEFLLNFKEVWQVQGINFGLKDTEVKEAIIQSIERFYPHLSGNITVN